MHTDDSLIRLPAAATFFDIQQIFSINNPPAPFIKGDSIKSPLIKGEVLKSPLEKGDHGVV